MYMYFVFVVGTGTGMSPHVVMRCVWWCITSRPLLLAWGGSTCSSGTMTIVKLRTTSSANTLQVLLPQYFNILLLWKDLNTVDPDSFFPTELPLDPSPSPNSTQTSKTHSVSIVKRNVASHDSSDSLESHRGQYTVWTLWLLFITDVFPSSVLPWNPSDHNQDRSAG